MPRPSTPAAPTVRADSSRGVSSGWYTRSATDLPGPQALGVEGQAPVVAHPDGRGVHDDVGVVDVVIRTHPPDGAGQRRQRTSAVACERFTTATSAAPASARAQDHGPGGTACAEHHHAGPPDRFRRRSRESTNPPPSVLWPSNVPSARRTTVFTAPSRSAVRRDRRRRRRPRPPCAASSRSGRRCPARVMAASAVSAWPSGTSKATYTQSSPRAAKAALWITGDSECRTGVPMTAATWVLTPGGHPPSDTGGLGVGDVGLEVSAVVANSWWRPCRRARSRAACTAGPPGGWGTAGLMFNGGAGFIAALSGPPGLAIGVGGNPSWR